MASRGNADRGERHELVSLRFTPLWIGLVAFATAGLSSGQHAGESEGRPSIVLLLADDLGWGDLGCYGNEVIQTPRLDRLASEGLRFTDCYAGSTVCSPSRAALLTGRVPDRTGVHDWIPPHPGHDFLHLPDREVTVATLLREAGYATSIVGKWHLSGRFGRDQPGPGQHGFDHWLVTPANLKRMKNPLEFIGPDGPTGEVEGYACGIVADEAIRWLREDRPSDRPFFQCIWFHEPHEPLDAPPELQARYAGEQGTRQVYYAAVTNLDLAVGRVLDALEELELADDTLVVFTSDNGPARLEKGYRSRSHGSAGPHRGYKWSLYEGGIRVPGIVRWLGRVPAGLVSDQPVSAVDLLPTLCSVAGIAIPEDRTIDGTDLTPLFSGDVFKRSSPLHWHYLASEEGPRAVMREGDWIVGADWDRPGPRMGRITLDGVRGLRASGLDGFRLWNVRDDPGQRIDLAAGEPERLEVMRTALEGLHRGVVREAPDWPARVEGGDENSR